MPPRNVILMTRTLGHGGTERQLTEIALSLDRSRFAPHVICVDSRGYRADELRIGGVPVLELPLTSLTKRQALTCAIKLRRYTRRHAISLMHAFDPAMNIFGVAVAKLSGGPVVLTSQRCYDDTVWPPYRRANRIAHFWADGIVANCDAMKRHLTHDYGVSDRKVHVCYNGLDTSVFYPAPAVRPAELRDATCVIGTVCVLRPEKGLRTLLEAFSLVKSLHPGLRLAIVGSGSELSTLENLSRDLGIANECLFHPSTNDVASWLRTIDVFVLPSLSEAFPNSLMEAMACGCCAVASRIGGVPELIHDGLTGMLFEAGSAARLAEKLCIAVESPELRNSLARQGQAFISERFSTQTSARRMEEIYSQVLQ